MEKIEIKGTIEKFYPSGKGFTVVVAAKSKDGRDWSKKYSVWTDNTDFAVGDLVYVSGLPSPSAYLAQDGTPKASIGINFPKIEKSSLEPVTPNPNRSADWAAPF